MKKIALIFIVVCLAPLLTGFRSTLLLVSTHPTSTPTPTPLTINGVYDLTNFNATVPASITSNSSVDGCSIRITGWSTIEPTEGAFDWSLVDTMISRCAGKKIALTLPAGYTTPAWVYTAGAASFTWIWDANFGPALCSTAKMPIPWDPVFQSKWATLITAFGAKYSNNPNITVIHEGGPLNSKDAELLLPHKSTQYGIGSGGVTCNGSGGFQCCEGPNDANWKVAGYTRTKMESAANFGLDVLMAAFPPAKRISGEYDPCSLPSIDANGNIFTTPGDCGDTVGAYDIINYGRNYYGNQRFIWQNDGLQISPFTELSNMWNNMLAATTTPSVVEDAFQFAFATGTTNFSTNMNTAISKGAKVVEAYETDLTNAGNATAITNAHTGLLANAVPTPGSTPFSTPTPTATPSSTPTPTGGRQFYVSNSGDNNNNGTSITTPWATIAKINLVQSTFLPDDHINFQAGGLWLEMLSLTNIQGSSGHPIVFTTYGSGARPIIDGSSARTSCINAISGTHKFFTVDGFECRNTTQYGITCQGGAGSCQGYTAQNNYIHNTGPGAFAGSTAVGPDTRGYCAAVGAGSGTDCNGNSITGTITAGGCDDCNYRNQLDCEDFGAGVGVDGCRFLNNIVSNCGGHNCLQVHYDAGSPLVQGNTVGPGCVHNCIDVKGAVAGQVTQNTATTGNTANLPNNPACYYAENTFTASSTISFTKNVCYGSEYGFQISTGGSCVGHVHCTQAVTVYNNTIYTPNTTAEALYSSDSSGNMADITLTAENNIWDGGNVFVNTAINRLDDYNDRGGVQGQQSNNMVAGPHSIANINPSYVSAASHNFQLNANSPVATAGNAALTGINSMGAFQAPPSGLPAGVPTPQAIPTPSPPTASPLLITGPGSFGGFTLAANGSISCGGGTCSAGGTDDTAAWQNILNSHDVTIQAASFRINGSLVIPPNRVIKCLPGATFIQATNTNQIMFSMSWIGGAPSGNDTISGCTLKGLDVASGAPGNYGNFDNSVGASYSKMIVINGNGTFVSHNYNIQNNTIMDPYGDGILTFTSCGNGPSPSFCNGVNPGLSTPDHIWIAGNTISHCTQPGIHFNGGQYVYAANNTLTDCNLSEEEDVGSGQEMVGMYMYHNTVNTSIYGENEPGTGTPAAFVGCNGPAFPGSNGAGCWAIQNTLSGCATATSGQCTGLFTRAPGSGYNTGNYYGNILQNGAVYDVNSAPQNQQLTVPYCNGVTCSTTGWLNIPPTRN